MHRFHPPLDARWSEPWWHGFLGWFIPFLFVAVLVALTVWAILRLTGSNRLASLPSAGWTPGPGTDSALDLVRTRYARGEIPRDEFVQLSSDLGGGVPEPPPDGTP